MHRAHIYFYMIYHSNEFAGDLHQVPALPCLLLQFLLWYCKIFSYALRSNVSAKATIDFSGIWNQVIKNRSCFYFVGVCHRLNTFFTVLSLEKNIK